MKIHQIWRRAFMLLAASCAPLAGVGAAQASITISVVPVGNAGNAPDPSTGSLYGAVSYNFNIGKYDVTLGQYTAFLNAVAATDTYGVFNSNMATSFATSGITRSGSSGSYSYSVFGNANYPVTSVTFWDTARFANWLNNGQPTGTEEATTDNGTYTLTPAAIANNTVTRNATGIWAVTSENEWYKAAYYNPPTGAYYKYATQSNTLPSNVLSATGTNNANYWYSARNYTDSTNYLTAVGAFAASPSAYGTFDQAGDVLNWNDTIGWNETLMSGSFRGLRGGWFGIGNDISMESDAGFDDLPTGHDYYSVGFRVSEVPEPASIGVLGLGAIALLVRRRGSQR